MQSHLVEPNLHAIPSGMVRHQSFGRKQGQLRGLFGSFIESYAQKLVTA